MCHGHPTPFYPQPLAPLGVVRGAQGRAKPDMIAFSELRGRLAPERRHGAMPGVKPGDKFSCTGQLAILSLHSAIPRGIDVP